MNRWWVLHDNELRAALSAVEEDDVTAAEAYAVLSEHTTNDATTPNLWVETHPA